MPLCEEAAATKLEARRECGGSRSDFAFTQALPDSAAVPAAVTEDGFKAAAQFS